MLCRSAGVEVALLTELFGGAILIQKKHSLLLVGASINSGEDQ